MLTCETPAVGTPTDWLLEVLLNGETAAPNLYNAPTLAEYDLSQVRISHVVPPAGPLGEATAVTLVGSGFARHGDGQLKVRVGAGGPLLDGYLLDGTRISVTLPAQPSVGVVPLALSLNAGTNGTFAPDTPAWRVYLSPTISAITPSIGDGNGGTRVTISGSGFEAFSDDFEARRTHLRCRFGSEVQSALPTYHDDGTIECVTTWGEVRDDGQPVSIALNTVSFSSPGNVRFAFKNLHKPVLKDVYFPQSDASTLRIIFDSQPTNRAGMNGQSDCSAVLSQRTIEVLQGTGDSAPQCDWTDDSTLVAYLTVQTLAAPGMLVGIRNDVLWPL